MADNLRRTLLAVEDHQPRIYIAGPFRAVNAWEIEANIRNAEVFGLQVAELNGIPVIPHTMYRFFQGALPDEFWIDADKSHLSTCHALALCREAVCLKTSTGTRGEHDEAYRRGLPIFYRSKDNSEAYASYTKPHTQFLGDWIAKWIEEHS